ncbi:MAG: penicillin acylase family protein [Sphingomonas sp.]|uniref:penicillin acylase family protein n=1 Tax=Sphingomonas sp. TaxID=28214 RepID=UPI0017EE449E|nr:penicillin acylase family protein [Sphingomonas sp.]MBA3666597.1 penicillin acylase family protein [Sphingomonas sp.]
MRLHFLPLAFLLIAAAPPPERQQWREQARRVTIARDDHGIAHIAGLSDADAVFGMIYAQAEDDFPRIEANYLTALGRTAEAEGEKAIWQDLRARLYVSENELKAGYTSSPAWLKRLMDGWAAGLNYYLATHPVVKPRALIRFEPWMALSFTEGSIGGDIERIDLGELEKYYSGKQTVAYAAPDSEPRGSNGIAIAPALTKDGKALLLINPHTSFFFRAEQQVSSVEGLNAYGAATWGQFFIYQGFNAHAGWMHTSSGVDSVDEFAVRPERNGKQRVYRYGKAAKPFGVRQVTIRYRAANGKMASRSFATLRTHRGPIVRAEGERLIAFAMMDRPVAALQQSYLRTKARDLATFLDVARLQANSSNNTLFADDKGEIAYLHPQFVPRRNDRFDYTKPVDGSDPAADWGPLHQPNELPNAITPPNGWVQNTNTWPWTAAGPFSADPKRYPKYMDSWGENPRGLHAVQLLSGSKGWTLDRLQAAAYDSFQPGFAMLVPELVKAWSALPASSAVRQRLTAPVAALRGWDYRWSATSVPTTLASFYGDELWQIASAPEWDDGLTVYQRIARLPAQRKLDAFATALDRLERDFGRWTVPWGEVNRFQRISRAIEHPFNDAAPSIPVPFASGRWGSLAAFGASAKPGTKRWYGTNGNSFVAVVEFGPRVRARAVTAGGESGDPASPHFNDQAARYAAGDLRPVYFYPDELRGHIERSYRPGE